MDICIFYIGKSESVRQMVDFRDAIASVVSDVNNFVYLALAKFSSNFQQFFSYWSPLGLVLVLTALHLQDLVGHCLHLAYDWFVLPVSFGHFQQLVTLLEWPIVLTSSSHLEWCLFRFELASFHVTFGFVGF